jgi:hypothetical protein
MFQLLTIEDYFTNLGAKMSIGNELGNLGNLGNLGCQSRVFDIACKQNRLRRFPILISAKLNKIISRNHLLLIINFGFRKCGHFSDKLLFVSCSIYDPELRIGS